MTDTDREGGNGRAGKRRVTRKPVGAAAVPKKLTGYNGYMWYLKAQRSVVAKEHPGLNVGGVSKQVAASWKQFPENEKKRWTSEAAAARTKHRAVLPDWMDGPPPKPMNPFMLFAQARRQELASGGEAASGEEAASGVGAAIGGEAAAATATAPISTQLSAAWADLQDRDRQLWSANALAEKLAYEHGLANWRKQCKYIKPPAATRGRGRPPKAKAKVGAAAAVKPKRPASPFIYFRMAKGPEVARELPELRPRQVAEELGRRWRGLGPEEKAPYARKYAAERARWQAEMLVYEQALGSASA